MWSPAGFRSQANHLYYVHGMLENIVRRRGLSCHKYADDMQIYGDFDPASDADHQRIQQQLGECLAEIQAWILSYILKIKDDKTELMVFMNPQQAKRARTKPPTITLGGCSITGAGALRNLRVTMDSCLDGTPPPPGLHHCEGL